MAIEVKVESHLDDITADLHGKMPQILNALALQAEGNAIDEITKLVYDTPESPNYIRTGNLRNSISHDNDDTAAYIGTNMEYAPYVEMGTRFKGARPFLKNAIANYTDEYKAIIESGLKT